MRRLAATTRCCRPAMLITRDGRPGTFVFGSTHICAVANVFIRQWTARDVAQRVNWSILAQREHSRLASLLTWHCDMRSSGFRVECFGFRV
jgi:hypothetical protein